MTEEEAKTKWCPFVRLGSGGINRYQLNRAGEHDSDTDMVAPRTTCIGTECMAWRYRYSHVSEGYCGLAGKPE